MHVSLNKCSQCLFNNWTTHYTCSIHHGVHAQFVLALPTFQNVTMQKQRSCLMWYCVIAHVILKEYFQRQFQTWSQKQP